MNLYSSQFGRKKSTYDSAGTDYFIPDVIFVQLFSLAANQELLLPFIPDAIATAMSKYGIDCRKCEQSVFIYYNGANKQKLVEMMMVHVKAEHQDTSETEVKGWLVTIKP